MSVRLDSMGQLERQDQVSGNAEGWLAALRGLPDNPLLKLWLLSERRQQAKRSRWLSSPGLLAGTTLLAALLLLVLLRHLPDILTGLRFGLGAESSAALFWLSLRGLLGYLLAYALMLGIGRFFIAMRNSIGLLETAAPSRLARLDDMLAITALSNRQILAAQFADNLRLLLPVNAALAFLFGLWQLSGAYCNTSDTAPDPRFIANCLLCMPLLSVLTSSLGLLILSSLMIGAGLQAHSARIQVGGAASLLLTQAGLFVLFHAIRSDYFLPDSLPTNFLPPVLIALIPLVLLMPAIGLAWFSELFRRLLAGGFGLWLGYVLTVLLGICILSDPDNWVSDPAMVPLGLNWGLQTAQVFNASPLLAMMYAENLGLLHPAGSRFANSFEGSWQALQLQWLPLALLGLQLLCLLVSLAYAERLLQRRRSGSHE